MPAPFPSESLDALASEALAGDSMAFARFAKAAGPLVYRTAMRLTADAADADDCTQETFVRAFLAFAEGRYQARGSAAAWLKRVVVRVALDNKREGRRRRAREAAWLPRRASSPDAPHVVALGEIGVLLQSLPAAQRIALVLKEVEGMSQREIADAMDCSEGAVEQRLVRARATLRKRLGDE